MDDMDLEVRVHHGSEDCPPYASLELGVPHDVANSWTLFFRDIESIRDFRNKLNAAIIKYDTRRTTEIAEEWAANA